MNEGEAVHDDAAHLTDSRAEQELRPPQTRHLSRTLWEFIGGGNRVDRICCGKIWVVLDEEGIPPYQFSDGSMKELSKGFVRA
jgi:hypothetical protein